MIAPDRILFNGSIYTQDPAVPRVTALALLHGRIVASGSDEQILALASASTIRDNLNGAFVIPGLTDAHLHWQKTTLSLDRVNLFDVPSKTEALRRVAERVRIAAPGEWIQGYGWAQDLWEDRRFPTAVELDSVSPNHPVYLEARSGHAGWANSAALRLCGISAATPDPEGGQLLRDETGEPTGILLEWPAMDLVNERIPKLNAAQLVSRMQRAQAHAHAVGLTGFHDFDYQDCFSALQTLHAEGVLSLRVVKNFYDQYLDSAIEFGLRWGFGDAWLRIGGLKMFADGAMGARTAAMIAPYDTEPDNYGIVVTDKEVMAHHASRASAAGLPSTIHAIGDRAVHDVLDVYAAVRREEASRGEPPESRRHRIEHVQLIHPDDVDRLAELSLIASMQPIHATSDYPMADRYWGERAPFSYNPRLQLDRGVTVAFGSDCPYDDIDPIRGIHAAVTRRRMDGSPGEEGWNPAARLSVAQAIHAYTIGCAYAAGMERQLGRLAPGYLADCTVLDQDLFAIDPHDIRLVKVLGTMVDGVWRHGSFA